MRTDAGAGMMECMVNYDRIIRECFWDSCSSMEELQHITAGDDLRLLIEGYRVPGFNYDHAFRRKNIAEVFFLDKELKIGELKWTA